MAVVTRCNVKNVELSYIVITILLVSCYMTATGNKAIALVPPAEMVARCWKEATYAMEVALGTFISYSAMCSPDYFQNCNATLPRIFINVAQLQPYQSDFLMSTFLSWINGGSKYLCNMGYFEIQNIMDHGGRICIEDFAAQEIAECNNKLALFRGGYIYPDGYCRNLDVSLLCYITATEKKCDNDKLKNFLWNFFRSVTWNSSCRETSRFGNSNSATPKLFNIWLLVMTIFAVFALSETC